MARRNVILGFLLLVGVLIGLTCEPDSGTAASVGPPDVSEVVGPNHAKPLPRLLSIADIVRTTATVMLMLVLLALVNRVGFVRVLHDGVRPRSVLMSLMRTRRGPPAPALGRQPRPDAPVGLLGTHPTDRGPGRSLRLV